MTEVKIRKADTADAKHIAQLNLLCWTQAYRGLLEDEILNNMSLDKMIQGYECFLNLKHSNKSIYVAELNESIIGFCTYAQINNKFDYEILALYVERSYWRLRIGSALINQVEQHIKKNFTQNLWVSTLKNNIRAQNFYHSCGFESTSIEKVFKNLDFCYPELVLQKKLK